MAARTAHDRPRWQLGLLSLLVSVGLLAGIDLGLRACGWVPPDDPVLFHARTHERTFSPFVPDGRGNLRIRPDWVNLGDGLRGVRGRRAGRTFLFPGFRPAHFARHKPPGTLRVFAFGGSTTFGAYAGPERAFPAVLEQRLREAADGRPVEVINLGCPGWASERVANLVPTALSLDADLVVVYSGHNEMLVGDVGAGSALTPAARLRAELLRVSTLFAWLNHAIASTLRARETELMREEVLALEAGHALTWDPWDVPPSERRPPDADFQQRAADAYARNLRRMAESAAAAGVPLIFALPVSNLIYAPVFGAERADPGAFEAAMEDGAAALAEQRFPAAIARFEEAVGLAPEHARAHHQLGLALLASGDADAARRALLRARDLDVRTHRMTSPLEAALVRVAEETGTPLLDLRPVFADALDPAASRLLFIDHLHPTAAGHERIAQALLPLTAQALGMARPVPASGAAARPGAG